MIENKGDALIPDNEGSINNSEALQSKSNTNNSNTELEEVKYDEIQKKECNCKGCFCSCGEEVLFALTFFGRLIMTLYSFHGLFFLYNFIIQFIILAAGILFTIDIISLQILFGLAYIIFAILASNILVIPTYEFLLFPFLRYRNVLGHLESFPLIINIIDKNPKSKEKIILNKSKLWVDILFFIIEIAYLIGFFLGFSSITIKAKDIIKIIILFIIYFYYLTIFLGYLVISIYLLYKLIKYIKKEKKNKCCSNFFLNLDEIINDFFNDKEPLPKINLLCYVINPLLNKSYNTKYSSQISNSKKCGCFCCNCCTCCECCDLCNTCILCDSCFNSCNNTLDSCFYCTKNILRILFFIIAFFLVLIIYLVSNKYILAIFFFLLLSVFMLLLSFIMSFPVLFRNKKTFGEFFSPSVKYNELYKLENPRLISFIRFICFIIIFLASLGLFVSFLLVKDINSLTEIRKLSFTSSEEKIDTKNLLLPNICFSTLHNLKLYLYMPFINDAYYYDDHPSEAPFFYSSFHIPGYKKLFFDDNVDIQVVGNLIEPSKNGEENVKMIQYNVKTPSNKLTILSIKGTSNKKDIFLDMQLYFPSVLLTLLSTFSIFGQQKDLLSFRFIEYSLSIPYRLFFQYLIVDDYLSNLKHAYAKNEGNFADHVVIVGHSLGGGLCKILGRLLKKQAISLSGPGVNAFHSLWGYEGKSENFEISAIDLVPDMDLVPRVEISGGTVYRIICKEGPLDCHSKNLSLCEVLIMCRNPNYKEYCKKMAGLNDEQINKIKESSELNQ